MITDLPIKFLQEKILELQSALFFPAIDSPLTIPTHVVPSAEADNEGQIWFVIPRPAQHIDAFEKEFPAKLDFFKKGKGFYLKIQGKAFIVTDAAEAKGFISKEAVQRIKDQKAVAIKVKVQTADYFGNTPKPSSNWIKNGGSQLYNWLLNPQYDHRNPQLVTIPVIME
jgi:general stress protein 26